MIDHRTLNSLRGNIQKSLIRTKQAQLHEQYGLELDDSDCQLAPEVQNEWLDYLLELERQYEQANIITVRERIGNPQLQPLPEIEEGVLSDILKDLLDLLARCSIDVRFKGQWTDQAAYHYLTGELLDEEVTDLHQEGVMTVFTPSTPEYAIEMGVEDFVLRVFRQKWDYAQAAAEQLIFDMQGAPITAVHFQKQLEIVWHHLPLTPCLAIMPLAVEVSGDEGWATAIITWHIGWQEKQVNAFFRLQSNPYSGWSVIQTSLLNALLTLDV